MTLRARDLATGAERWSTTLKQIDYAQFIGIANGVAYARAAFSGPTEQDPPPGSDVLLAFDASTGKLRWLRVPPAPGTGVSAIGDALVDGTHVFVTTASVGAPGSTVSAIDAAGTVAWQTTVNLPSGHLVADAGHTIEAVSFVPLHPDQTGVSILTSFDETNGASTSRFLDIGPNQVFSPDAFSFANGLLYTTTPAVGLVAVHPGDGTRAWNVPGEGLIAVAPGSVVSATPTGIAARNPLTGALIWNNTTAGNAWDQAVAGGVIIFVSNNTLQAFSLATGVAAGGTQSVPGFDPQVVAGDGRIVVTNGMGLHVLAPSG
jgi:outer membrane protein assembly factor BamB